MGPEKLLGGAPEQDVMWNPAREELLQWKRAS